MTLFAKQDAPNVPAYTITDNGEMVGTITCFPNEGVAYTVHALGYSMTRYTAKTIAQALEGARADYLALLDGTSELYEAFDRDEQDEDDIEDEDGDLAMIRHAENRAQEWADREASFPW